MLKSLFKILNTTKEYYLKSSRYSLLAILVRVSLHTTFAILLIYFDEIFNRESFPFLIIFGTLLMFSETTYLVDYFLDKLFSKFEQFKIRFILQVSIGFVIILINAILVAKFFPHLTYEREFHRPVYERILGLIVAMSVVFYVTSYRLIMRMMTYWVESQKKIEQLKREKLQLDYNVLQDQLNPHFLFNNLSVLKSLIMFDKQSALSFTEDFTDVYRYVLQVKDLRTIKLQDEIEFIKAFTSLHKERIGEGFQVNFNIDSILLDTHVAPLSLQLLVENAIKHNVTDKNNPLIIKISSVNEYLEISNNIIPKESSYSTKKGLSNLIKRYEIISEQKVEIINDLSVFKVRIPLL